MARLCVFNSFWTTTEFLNIDKSDYGFLLSFVNTSVQTQTWTAADVHTIHTTVRVHLPHMHTKEHHDDPQQGEPLCLSCLAEQEKATDKKTKMECVST